jgi:cis-3-alkyl-4-acyloxetan-2-one decarboxylase
VQINNVEVIVEGAGAKSIVMIHGWPDTHRLWDAQVAALSERYRCVRFTLPGFEHGAAKRAYSLDEIVETVRQIVSRACPGERVVLLLHDWGCLFGYQLAQRHPQLVERVIAVDVGDAGSRRNVAELSLKARLMVVFYQLWLALAWAIGGATGDRMARWMARALRCPVAPQAIHSRMGYPYAVRWLRLAGGLRGLKTFHPQTPMLFLYGERKPFLFHSRAWAERVGARAGSRVVALPTGHWVMVGRPREFNDALLSWLGETGSQEASSASALK